MNKNHDRCTIEQRTRWSAACLLLHEVEMGRVPVGYSAAQLRIWRSTMRRLAKIVLASVPRRKRVVVPKRDGASPD